MTAMAETMPAIVRDPIRMMAWDRRVISRPGWDEAELAMFSIRSAKGGSCSASASSASK